MSDWKKLSLYFLTQKYLLSTIVKICLFYINDSFNYSIRNSVMVKCTSNIIIFNYFVFFISQHKNISS